MQKKFISLTLFVFLAGFSSLAIGQTTQENVTVNGKQYIKTWSANKSSYVLKPAGITGRSSQQKTVTDSEPGLHFGGPAHSLNGSSINIQKNKSQITSQVKPAPVMPLPVMRENFAPKK